uniref:Uncharacterized protein n=1 Tax=viral metagenome TaxID=1070528 RepID=A0A6C0JWI4_9ZZZZ
MAKKCIPGVICIENMTLFILLLVIGLVVYMIYSQHKYNNQQNSADPTKIVVIQQPTLASVATRRNDSFNDPYSPPLKNDGYYHPRDSSDIRGIPVNIETRGSGMSYQQIGILTPMNGSGDALILPLMGRKWLNGRDKWQYYTMTNGNSNISAKLPVSVNGKSCTGEYGCNEIQNGDTVYVEGYKTTFSATVYENGTFSYIPYL